MPGDPEDAPVGRADSGRAGPGRASPGRADPHPAVPVLSLRHAAKSFGAVRADTVYIVGGGARNELLCQLTADACGLPVVAGPAEAAALGNVLVQARALGVGPSDLDGMRALIRATQPLRRFEPVGDARASASAAQRLSS